MVGRAVSDWPEGPNAVAVCVVHDVRTPRTMIAQAKVRRNEDRFIRTRPSSGVKGDRRPAAETDRSADRNRAEIERRSRTEQSDSDPNRR